MGGFDPGFTGKAVSGLGFGDHVAGMALANDDSVIIAGTFVDGLTVGSAAYVGAGANDMYVLKLDVHGEVVWGRGFGNLAEQSLTAMALAGDGSIIIAGHFTGALPLAGINTSNSVGSDGFVAKLSPGGATLWARVIGGTGVQLPNAIAVDSATGNIAVGGTFSHSFHAGTQELFSGGDQDAFLLVLDGDGNTILQHIFGGMGNDTVAALAWLDGDLILAGDFAQTIDFGAAGARVSAGNSDIFLARMSVPSAEVSWAHIYGDDDTQRTAALSTANGRIALAASVRGVVDVGGGVVSADATDGVVLQLQGDGTYHRHFAVDGDGDQILTALFWLDDGGFVVGGHFQSILGIDGSAEASSADGGDTFLLRTAAPTKNAVQVYWVRHFAANTANAVRNVKAYHDGHLVAAGDMTGTLQLDSLNLTTNGMTDGYVLQLEP